MKLCLRTYGICTCGLCGYGLYTHGLDGSDRSSTPRSVQTNHGFVQKDCASREAYMSEFGRQTTNIRSSRWGRSCGESRRMKCWRWCWTAGDEAKLQATEAAERESAQTHGAGSIANGVGEGDRACVIIITTGAKRHRIRT